MMMMMMMKMIQVPTICPYRKITTYSLNS